MKIEDLIEKTKFLTENNFELIKDSVDTFILANIENRDKRKKYLDELSSISIEQSVYYRSIPWINDFEANVNNLKAKQDWFNRWKNELINLLEKIKFFLESNINYKVEEKKESKNIVINTLNNHWNFALENNWTQNIQNINNEIDKIIKLLETKNFSNKDELKNLLEEFKETQDKSKLEKVVTNLASVSWIWSLITSIIALF